ncbi:glycine-rich protein DC9.1 [Galendromus occidentalis]|uniref:Glycine-rich protein DC9.1 n=1 Tax=Galendromus occidentalis TaxID=34638 RepID=A0AAJ6QRY9_9ACAR|nr:glycine-rich protein DC9.1 [Galendromus occidentalis]
MKLFLCFALVALSAFATAAEEDPEAKNVKLEVPADGTETKTADGKESVEERGLYRGHHGGYGGGFGGGFDRFGSQAQAGGFNQGSNQHAQANQFNNAAGFKNTQGFREQQGFSHSNNNQYGSGFNTAAGGYQNQQGGFGQAGGSYGQGGGFGFGRR